MDLNNDAALLEPFTFLIRGKIYGAASFDEARHLFNNLRDESGEGASTWITPALYREGKVIGWFSYNGRVWAQKAWTPETLEIKEA